LHFGLGRPIGLDVWLLRDQSLYFLNLSVEIRFALIGLVSFGTSVEANLPRDSLNPNLFGLSLSLSLSLALYLGRG
jgi:hypothetical protein